MAAQFVVVNSKHSELSDLLNGKPTKYIIPNDIRKAHYSAHELRIPITVIKEVCSLVNDGTIPSKLTEEDKSSLERIIENCDNIATLINKIVEAFDSLNIKDCKKKVFYTDAPDILIKEIQKKGYAAERNPEIISKISQIEETKEGYFPQLKELLGHIGSTLQTLNEKQTMPKSVEYLRLALGNYHRIQRILFSNLNLLDERDNAKKGHINKEDIKKNFKPTNIYSLVEDIVQVGNLLYPDVSFACECQDKNLTLNLHPHFDQALINLFANAAKYGAENVKVGIKAKGQRYIALYISDNGNGIPEEEKTHIFKDYYRIGPSAPNSIKKPGGLGLGLAIVKYLVKISGGKIEVNSKVGEGTTFKLYLLHPT